MNSFLEEGMIQPMFVEQFRCPTCHASLTPPPPDFAGAGDVEHDTCGRFFPAHCTKAQTGEKKLEGTKHQSKMPLFVYEGLVFWFFDV